MNSLNGIQDLLRFLEFLSSRKIWFRLEQTCPDSVMVTLTLLGERIEVDFFEDHIEFSRFRGDESVERDVGLLFSLIAEFK